MNCSQIKVGDRFGRLVVLEEVEPIYEKQKIRRYLCQCDCGNTKIVRYNNLLYGGTRSCGCLVHDGLGRKYPKKLVDSRLYVIWNSIKERCYCPNSTSYPRYGAKGISMCDQWRQNFMSFYNWAISNGYSDELSIDRIIGTGNYEPSNCRWASDITQSNNRSSNVRVTCNGETHTLAEWCRIIGIQPQTLYYRLNRAKWSVEKALMTPVKQNKKLRLC